MRSALLLPAQHQSDQSRARESRAAHTHRTHLETKTRRHSVADKSRYKGGKNVDRPAPPKSQDNRAFLLLRDAIECRNEICTRKRARLCRRARHLHLQSTVSLAAIRSRSRVAPSIWRKTVVPRRVLCGGNCWG